MKNRLDDFAESMTRRLAQRVTRRSLLHTCGEYVFRFAAPAAIVAVMEEAVEAQGCGSWQYKGVCGKPCACCGGTSTKCPAGMTLAGCWWHYVRDATGKVRFVSYCDCMGRQCNCAMCRNRCGDNCSNTLWGGRATYGCTVALVDRASGPRCSNTPL